MTAQEAWAREYAKSFKTLGAEMPEVASFPPPSNNYESTLKEQAWIAFASWTVCPRCGLRSFTNKLEPGWEKQGGLAVEVPCDGGCDPSTSVLEAEVEDGPSSLKKTARIQAYMTPSNTQTTGADSDELAWPVELLTLTKAEAASLAIITLHVDYETVRGGKASTTNKKKTSVTRATWRRSDVESELPTDAARSTPGCLSITPHTGPTSSNTATSSPQAKRRPNGERFSQHNCSSICQALKSQQGPGCIQDPRSATATSGSDLLPSAASFQARSQA